MQHQPIRIEETTISCNLSELSTIDITLVNQTAHEVLWDQLVRQYHYLGYTKMFGPRVKYLATVQNRPIAAISYNRATLKVGARDCFIGWDETLKQQHLHQVVCQNRFLILPWVKVKNLASHLLSRTLRLLKEDWQSLYGTTPFLVETFVEKDRFLGTCYKAAGWKCLGQTRGHAKQGSTYRYHGRHKIVFVKVLDHRFRRQLGVNSRPLPIVEKKGRGQTMLLSVPDYDPDILKACGLKDTDIPAVAQMLKNYLDLYRPCYTRSDQKRLADTFIKGLLSDLERKSLEPVALRYSQHANVRSLQMFFKKGAFDDERMLTIYQQTLFSHIGDEDGMLSVDGSDFQKKGTNSVGVARQHCGILGKTENCQAGVFLGYSSRKGYGLLDRRLYLPQKWFSPEYEQLRKECAVPEDLTFSTKNQLATMMIQKITENGHIPYK